jgi:hypothetical protein
MFRTNEGHQQHYLISNIKDLLKKHYKRLDKSWASVFYTEIFCRLDEEPFAVLYADIPSRPNIPVNVLVGLECIKIRDTSPIFQEMRSTILPVLFASVCRESLTVGVRKP